MEEAEEECRSFSYGLSGDGRSRRRPTVEFRNSRSGLRVVETVSGFGRSRVVLE